ncbi:hypothetical protein M406DRAFT_283413 [Cryphonectria parasitica EP155]|uniref:magnesium chelatase n=1 Tax=Cryphonectria parasitica (strain ATCC 38755 / EP155) TaxID=660469 RepID=A0A9P4XRU3_CRYP1|nr:uncharacterized protein M406DRAFT_283413 [Cryphonectria parasitica EP155]KAF3760299.1 hypothetical protein M406DRAFT_283413 [Cryphonectria parasitica EP155]
MADNHVLAKVHSLSDVELACLLSLISDEHCMISTPPGCLDELVDELQLVSEHTFGLRSAVVDCTPHTTLEDFASSLLLHPHPPSPATTRSFSPYLARSAHDSYFPSSHAPNQHNPIFPLTPVSPTSPTSGGPLHSQIANVVLAKNLDQAPKAVQIQALELLRTHRIFTRTSVQTAPKTFMLVAVLGAESGGEARVTPHLNDFFYVAHWVDPDSEGFAHLYGDDGSSLASSELKAGGRTDDDDDVSIASAESVVKRRTTLPRPPIFSSTDLTQLRQLSHHVSVDIDVTRYQMNIVSFLRMHRAVASGVTPQATRHFETLMKSLAPLHGVDYVTPALVCLAARKVYLHRIKMVEPGRERSMQWGSDLNAVERLLEGWGPEDVVEDVLQSVGVPV